MISVIANSHPADFSEMMRCALRGDMEKARQLNNKLFPLHKWLYVDGNPAGIKAACSLAGICGNYLRLPLVPMQERNFEELRKTFEAID